MSTPSPAYPPILLEGPALTPEIFVAAALIVTPDGRYLFQLRDDKPLLPLRNHWALFGGAVEPGEDGRAAILREIDEELSYKPGDCTWFHEAIFVLPRRKNRVVRKSVYLMPTDPAAVDHMILSEGAAMKLMTVAELLALPNVAPWDLNVVLMHSRVRTIFPDE
jgi:8-oxo-dGTP pyrophosphatase MutT (NUDIX family)